MILETKKLSKTFGGLKAVSEVDMQVAEGEIVGLIGPNGAGKSTFFNLITGVLTPSEGRVFFKGNDITFKKPHEIAELGIGRSFQLNPLFGDFTVMENVAASFHLHPKSNMWQIFFNTTAYRKNESLIAEKALEILHLLGLENVSEELARNLPHGFQKMLGVARALAVQPRMLLLDEPLGGMNPSEIEFALEAIRKIHQQGVSILIVEHNMQILDLCDRVVVISFGQKISEGLPNDIRENKEVIRAYFGGEGLA